MSGPTAGGTLVTIADQGPLRFADGALALWRYVRTAT